MNNNNDKNNKVVASYPAKDKPFLKKTVSARLSDIRLGLEKMAEDKCEQIARDFGELIKQLDEIAKARFVEMKNVAVWYDKEVAALYPNEPGTWGGSSYFGRDVEDSWCIKSVEGLDLSFKVPSYKEVSTTFKKENIIPYTQSDTGVFVKGQWWYNILYYDNGYGVYQNRKSSRIPGYYDGCSNILMMSIGHLNRKNSKPFTDGESISAWMKYGLIPSGLNYSAEKLYKEWLAHYSELEYYLHPDDNGKLIFDGKQLMKDVKSGKFKGVILNFDFDLAKRIENIKTGKEQLKDFTYFKNMLLQSDYLRANIAPYADKQVTDINVGHWDLFEADNTKESIVVQVPKGERIVARPPQLDVVEGGICGIDFGTKSTVVACRQQEAVLLRVGKGDYSKEPVVADYENPTVIQLRDIEEFMQAYNEREGRPETRWEQLTVSHQAADAIFSNKDDSEIYYTVFSELKQWANDKNRRLLLKDNKNKTIEIKPYLQLKDGDLDPIEIYAYYLGMYINNMHNHIYLDYILSFPVNYSKEVREHLLHSFEKGIKKSLPLAILKDQDLMDYFRVYAGASEPAAYAISALQENNLQPQKEGDKVCYGVFDFGGGTTDFDFGIMSVPKDRRKNRYQIEQFGNGGDVYLGGENILDLLAYEVYKANLAEMRTNDIPFVLPPQAKAFAGAETLVYDRKSASQQAYLNCKRMAKELRPLWERQADYKNHYPNNSVDLTLFTNKKGVKNNTVSVKLIVDINKLEECIRKRIEQGVVNFFIRLKDAFKNTAPVLPVHIFLAGNSSKHPYVKDLFEKYIKKEEAEFKKYIKRTNGVSKNTENCFKLYMPLGMEAVSAEAEKAGTSNEATAKPKSATENINDAAVQKEIESLTYVKQRYCETLELAQRNKNRARIEECLRIIAEYEEKISGLQSKTSKPVASKGVASGKPQLATGKPKVDTEKKIDIEFNRLHTGKTGVVFGLLRSRKGGKDVKIINRNDNEQGETRFPFFLGDIDENGKFHVVIGQGVGYNVWAEFTYADEEDFELSYTTEAKALEGSLDESEVKTLHCRIKRNEVREDDNVKIFVRKVAPDKIEYAVGTAEDFQKGFKGNTYSKMLNY